MNDIPTSLIAAIGSIVGAVTLEITRRWLSRAKDKNDMATTLRAELRNEIAELKREIDDLEDQLDEWKTKYYDLRESYLDAKIQVDTELPNVMPTLPEVGNVHDNPDDTTGGQAGPDAAGPV